jgi:hypothetical protein
LTALAIASRAALAAVVVHDVAPELRLMHEWLFAAVGRPVLATTS